MFFVPLYLDINATIEAINSGGNGTGFPYLPQKFVNLQIKVKN
nr:hypothetical protein [Okeania sp. SIO2F4]